MVCESNLKWLTKTAVAAYCDMMLIICDDLHFSLVQSVEGMKVVCHELTQASSDPDGSLNEDLVKETDRLVSCLATMVFDIPYLLGAL